MKLQKCPRCEKYGEPQLSGYTSEMKEIRTCEHCGWKLKEVNQ